VQLVEKIPRRDRHLRKSPLGGDSKLLPGLWGSYASEAKKELVLEKEEENTAYENSLPDEVRL